MNEIENEVWLDVPGFEERYRISTFGRLRAKALVIERPRFGKTEILHKKPRWINPTLDSCGYPQVKLYLGNGKFKSFKLHKIVALAFLENVENLPFINHKDGNKENPKLSNLERCTAQQNTRHAWRTGLCTASKGEGIATSKLKDSDIPAIRTLIASGMDFARIGKQYGVTGTCIYYVAKGATWKHIT